MATSSSLKQRLEKKIPLRHQREPSFFTLLELIELNNIDNEERLHSFLEQNVYLLESQVEKIKAIAFHAKTLHDQISQLEALKKCQGLIKQFGI